MKLLITDLDNTLYDWVGFYASAFDAMADALVEHLGVPKEQLLDEFQTAHQGYGNSEQPFAVLELPSVHERYPQLSRAERAAELDSVLHAFNSARRKHLVLYPGVGDTLRSLRSRGIVVVGHTEAIVENAYYRVSSLGIAEYFTRLYALRGVAVEHPEPERAAALKPPPGFVHVLPPEERKPNPRLLLDICRRENVDARDCWYVGDSLTRDVTMAAQAGCVAVWARYGTDVDPAAWQKLVRITHWTKETVARDEELRRASETIEPDYTIDSFADLLSLADESARLRATA
jgi:phosphoglycolate phosphatase-like HAD superfamily hydrolase